MQATESKIQLHVFICTNQKPGDKPCCANKQGKEIRDELKNRINSHPELKNKVRINASGCLDKCEAGVACVIYPSGEWLIHIAKDDLGKLEDKILQTARKL